MLYISDGQLEHCSAQKREITVACPSIWIHYVISGKGYYNGVPLGRGEAFIVYKNDVCRYAPDREEPWTYAWVRLEGRDDEGLLAKCGLPSVSGVFSFDYAEELARMADVLFSETYALNTNQAYKEASAKLVLSLHTGSGDEHEQKWDERWVTRAKDYIAASYHKGIRVEEIARELHVDRKYLRNLFVKYTGRSTKEYLDAYRMTRAKELLSLGEASVGIVVSGSGSVREHVQRLGRILRHAPDKEQAVLYELVSANTSEESISERRREHSAYRRK